MDTAILSRNHRMLGQYSAFAVTFLGVIYAGVLILGLRSLSSPNDPIENPFFFLMELIILLMAPLFVVCLGAVHSHTEPEDKIYSLIALVFMAVAAALTSGIHFVILSVGEPLNKAGPSWIPLLLSYKWPSLVYSLDILAWDWFFALSLLFAALVFRKNGLEKRVRILMLSSGILSLVGLLGVPNGDMKIRMIGVVGYAVIAPIAFLMLGLLFRRHTDKPQQNAPKRNAHESEIKEVG